MSKQDDIRAANVHASLVDSAKAQVAGQSAADSLQGTEPVENAPDDPLNKQISDYVEAAYLHGLSVENLDTGELEPPKDISEVRWITERIEALIKAEVVKELKKLRNEMEMHTVPEGRHLITRSYLNNSIDFRIAELEEK